MASPIDSMSTLDIAQHFISAGFNVIPIKPHTDKHPNVSSLDFYKDVNKGGGVFEANKRIAFEDVLRLGWWSDPGKNGIAVIGGLTSGGLIYLDIEYPEFWEGFESKLEEVLPGLLARTPQILTPGKAPNARGKHYYFRHPDAAKSRHLARMNEAVVAAMAAQVPYYDVGHLLAIEIKSKGGYVLTVGNPGSCHPSGRCYEHVEGTPPPWQPLDVTDEQIKIIIGVCQEFDFREEVEQHYDGSRYAGNPDMPGTQFNQRGRSIPDMLCEHGWTQVREMASVTLWRRPGKDDGHSATYGHKKSEQGVPLFYCFSLNGGKVPSGKYLDPFGLYTHLYCGGDFSAAAKALRNQGYGSQEVKANAASSVKVRSTVKHEDGSTTTEMVKLGGGNLPPPDGSKKADRFPIEAFPTLLQKYVTTLCDSVDGPVDFGASAVLAASSSALGNTYALRVKSGWVEAARLFLCTVARPGSAKSPIQTAVMRALSLIHAKRIREFKSEQRRYERDKENNFRPTFEHVWTNNSTVEGLRRILENNERGILYYSDEISGLFEGMGQYKQGRGDDRQTFLSCWSGEPFSQDRAEDYKKDGRGRPVFSQRPFMGVCGGIQPMILPVMSRKGGAEDGLVHRFLFSSPEHRDMGHWNEAVADELAERRWLFSIDYMHSDYEMAINEETGEREPNVIDLSPEGKHMFVQWFNNHVDQTKDKDFSPMLIGPWSKFKSYAIRLILTIHAIESSIMNDLDDERIGPIHSMRDPVSLDTVYNGLLVTEYFKNHARNKIYPLLNTPDDMKVALVIYECARDRYDGEITKRDILRHHLVKSSEECDQIVAKMEQWEWIDIITERSKNGREKKTIKIRTEEIKDN